MRTRIGFGVVAPLIFMASVHVVDAANVCLEVTPKIVMDFVVISDPKTIKVGEAVPIVGSVLDLDGVTIPFSGSAVRTDTDITISVLAFAAEPDYYRRIALSWHAVDETFEGLVGVDLPPLFDNSFDLQLTLVKVSCSNVTIPTSAGGLTGASSRRRGAH